MPLYSYRCDTCHTTTEILAKMSDPPPKICATCGAEGTMRKLLARTSFKLKGSGWYRQGYEGASNRKDDAQKESSRESTSSGDGGRSESSSSGQAESSSSGTHGSSSALPSGSGSSGASGD